MQNIVVALEFNEIRLDVFLNALYPAYSRSYFKTLIEGKTVTVNGIIPSKAGYIIKTNDVVEVTFPESRTFTEHHESDACKNSGIELIFEHSDFAIIYKPAGIITHHRSATSKEFSVVDWLTYTFSHIKDVGYSDRPGIVHRLDQDTSGLMVVALNNKGHSTFGKLFHDRKIDKIYYAIVEGKTPSQGVINYPIGRNPFEPHRMAVVGNGRHAITEYKTIEYFENNSLLEVKLLTGRTHQIRVHCAYIGHPLVGDKVYGKTSDLINRQALHAAKLSFEYDGTLYSFEKEIPLDIKNIFTL